MFVCKSEAGWMGQGLCSIQSFEPQPLSTLWPCHRQCVAPKVSMGQVRLEICVLGPEVADITFICLHWSFDSNLTTEGGKCRLALCPGRGGGNGYWWALSLTHILSSWDYGEVKIKYYLSRCFTHMSDFGNLTWRSRAVRQRLQMWVYPNGNYDDPVKSLQ